MFSRVYSATTLGVDAYVVEVEVDIASGMPSQTTVGLPDAAVKESRSRVWSAILNCDFSFPNERVTFNLAPADTRKEGPSFDLPMALGVLGAQSSVDISSGNDLLFIGELALDGTLRPVSGVLPIALMARDEPRFRGIVLPKENATEAALVDNVSIFPAGSLEEVILFLEGRKTIEPFPNTGFDLQEQPNTLDKDFSDVKGQEHAKRALEIASAGNHNVIMIGPPGGGKTMLAKRLPTILPRLSREEALEVTKLYSINDMLRAGQDIVRARPFRAPHHTISNVALIGGGSFPKPGEVSLSHHGVLFLDELTEFKRDVLEVLRQPLEDGTVTISRASTTLTFPASFVLVAAMNPCPCGWYGDYVHPCSCNATQIQRYMKKVSGPLLDRIDIHCEVPRLDPDKLTAAPTGESSETIRARANEARERQLRRYRNEPIFSNAELNARMMREHCTMPAEAEDLLKNAIKKLGYTARAYDRVRKLSRTIADLAGRDDIRIEDVAEAITLRSLDKKYMV